MIKKIKENFRKHYLYNRYVQVIIYIRQLRHSVFLLQIEYWLALLINKAVNIYLSKNKNPNRDKNSWQKIETVLIIYSEKHFDPLNDQIDRNFHYSGIANIGRNIWKLLEEKNKIYIDINEKLDTIPQADLIIGLMSKNFLLVAKANSKSQKILLLVNSHPLYRAKMLLDEVHLLHKILPATEWISPKLFFSLLFQIDKIILIGNEYIKNTYLSYGLTSIPIFPIDIGINTDILFPKPELHPTYKTRFIYPASHMAIRKGLFRIFAVWKKLNTLVSPDMIELYLVGGEELLFKNDMKKFITCHLNAHNLGWLSEKEQILNFQSSHAILAPSLEEGQVSTVMEAMSCGSVPIMTRQCGINIRDGIEGFYIKNFRDTEEIVGYMKKIIDDKNMTEIMSKKAISIIEKEHQWQDFRHNFKKIILM